MECFRGVKTAKAEGGRCSWPGVTLPGEKPEECTVKQLQISVSKEMYIFC